MRFCFYASFPESRPRSHAGTNDCEVFVLNTKKTDRRARLFPSLLLAFVFPFTVLLFGPFEIYASNLTEFQFSLGDFFPLCLGYTALLTGLFFLLLYLPGERAYKGISRILFALSLLFFVQGNYLNLGLSSLEGDGGFSEYSLTQKLVNIGIWLAVTVGVWFLFRFLDKHSLTTTVTVIACITLIGMQLVSFAVLAVGDANVFRPVADRTAGDAPAVEKSVLTQKNMTSLAEDGNVYVFVIDRFDGKYAEETMEKDPDLFAALDGFTYYDDNLSLYARTYPSVPYMLTGEMMDYDNVDRVAYFEKAYGGAEQLEAMKAAGYTVNIYTEPVYAYEDAAVMAGYTDNVSVVRGYYVTNKLLLSGGMLGMSVYRYLPLAAKTLLGGVSTMTCAQTIGYDTDDPAYSVDLKNVYDIVRDADFTVKEGKQFSFLHVYGCHQPIRYGENMEKQFPSLFGDMFPSVENSFLIINEYIDALKENGLYEDATILITGDHGDVVNNYAKVSEPRLTALFYKPSGASGTPLVTSHAPVCHANMWASLAQSEGVTMPLDEQKSFADVAAAGNWESVTREYYFHRWGAGLFEILPYTVTGRASDFDNWQLASGETQKISGSEYQ